MELQSWKTTLNKQLLFRSLIGLLALYGTIAAFGISQLHMSGAEACPSIGPVPACYAVLIGYLAMLISVISTMKWVFWSGWLPVFLLATIGAGSELLSSEAICPQTDGGIPKCYFSFLISFILGIAGFLTFNPRT